MRIGFNRKTAGYVALAAGLLVVVAVGVAAFQSMQVPLEAPPASTPSPATGCTPPPCANVRGFTLWVAGLKTSEGIVEMQITFRNSSEATHADPSDLVLIDSARHESHLDFGLPECTQWGRHEFNGGATYGPLAICFHVTSTSPPLVLRWSPDFGLFCCRRDIRLD